MMTKATKKKYLSPKIAQTIFALFLTMAITLANLFTLRFPLWLDYLIAINISALLFYLYDKIQAAQGKFRVPEITLLILLGLGGDLGALVGVFRGRHKSQSERFLKPALLIILAHAVIFLSFLYFKTRT